MIISKYAVALFLLFISFSFFACKKSDDAVSLTKAELLNRGFWDEPTVSGTTQVLLRSCDLDNYWNFSADGGLLIDLRKQKCEDQTNLDEIPGTWNFSDNESKLGIKVKDSLPTFNIIKLDMQELVLQRENYQITFKQLLP